jgi:hypothetical protein
MFGKELPVIMNMHFVFNFAELKNVCSHVLHIGQVKLISRLSSRVKKNIGRKGGFHFIFFPIEKLLTTILFLSPKGVSFNAPDICS